MKSKFIVRMGIALAVILVIGIIIYLTFSMFPGKLKPTIGQAVQVDGIKSTFQQGAVYRYPGMVPMLEVKGDHYEMGLQYGVLLRPEIIKGIESYEKILRWQAQNMGIPYRLLVTAAKLKAKQIGKKIPDRFLREIQGISDGSGVPFDTILTISLFYDIQLAKSCSGLLMKGENGTIIHGRNQDASFFGGEELAKLAVIVKYNANGYHTVTQQDFILFLGIDTGYNDQGLGFSEEVLPIKTANKKGNSLGYFTRMVLEECSTLAELQQSLDEYAFIGGYGMVWSDRDMGEGFVAEVAGAHWGALTMEDSILWNFNRYYSTEMKQYQAPGADLYGDNWDREEIAESFEKKATYTLNDAITFLRSREGLDGRDYSWTGSKTPIANQYTQQMIIFDPNSDGFYYALGTYFGGLSEVYHILDDFSIQPVQIKKRIPLNPIVEEAAKIENMLISKVDKLEKHRELADKYPDDAKAQFKVAYESLRLGKVEYFSKYAEQAYVLDPTFDEYKLYAGLAAYQQSDYKKSTQLLTEVDQARLNPEQKLYLITVLERIYKESDSAVSKLMQNQRESMIKQFDAESYYKKRIASNIKLLESNRSR